MGPSCRHAPPLTTIISRSTAEMDELFERDVRAWRWSKFETAAEQQLKAYMENDKRSAGEVGVRATT